MRKLGLLVICLAACGDDAATTPDAAVQPDPDAEVPDAEIPPPTIAITSHTDGATVVGARAVTIAGTTTNEVTSVEVAVGGGTPVVATLGAGTFTADVQLLDGTATVTATATGPGGADTASIALRYPFVSLTTFQDASLVLGQPDATTGTVPTVADARALQYPFGRAAWDGETLWVPSSGFNRILAFHGFPARTGEPADFAIGQDDLDTGTIGTGLDGLDYPQAAQLYGGKLYVLDWGGSRILVWNTPPSGSGFAPDFVIGQPSLVATGTACGQGGTSNLDDFIIAGDKLFVSDRGNNRVLIWNALPTADGALPDVVLGQFDFDHCTADDDDHDDATDATPSARTLDRPSGIYSDGATLWVADVENHRVLVWNTIPTASFTAADWVLGQADFTGQDFGATATTFHTPKQLASNGNQLAIADTENNRVLVWNTMPTAPVTPDVILGQDDPTEVLENAGGAVAANTMDYPTGVAFVRDALAVAESDNNRVLLFGPLACPAGQYEPPGQVGTCVDDPCEPDPCTDQLCRNDSGAAVCF